MNSLQIEFTTTIAGITIFSIVCSAIVLGIYFKWGNGKDCEVVKK